MLARKNKKVNRVLVLDGGGMQGSFMVGILKYFNEHGIRPEFFDCIVGTSVGAYDACYWATDQFKEGLRIWEKHLPNGFIKWKKLVPKVDIKYLEKVITKIEPLDIEKLRALKTNIYMPLSNPKTLRANFVCLNKTKEPINALLAGVAMPFFSHYKIYKNKRYYDGGLIAQPPLDFAKKLKPKEIWILLTYPKGFRLKKWIYNTVAWVLASNLSEKKLLQNCPDCENPIFEEIDKSEIYKVIRPEKTLPVNWLNNDSKKIMQSISLGEKSAKKFFASKKIIKT